MNRRPECKSGLLLKETEKAKNVPGPGRGHIGEKAGGTARPAFSSAKTLRDYGLSKDQSSHFQKLADVPRLSRETKTWLAAVPLAWSSLGSLDYVTRQLIVYTSPTKRSEYERPA
jgi:hypothetical protein